MHKLMYYYSPTRALLTVSANAPFQLVVLEKGERVAMEVERVCFPEMVCHLFPSISHICRAK